MTAGPGPGTVECGSGITNQTQCEDTLGCCFKDTRTPKCVYPRLVTKGVSRGRCIRCDQNPAECWTAKICYPRYCPYPARGRMPWTHELSVVCKHLNSTTGIPLGEVCTFQCKVGFISAAADYKCQITQPFVGVGAVSDIATKQQITMTFVLGNGAANKYCVQPADDPPVNGSKVKVDTCGTFSQKWNLPPSGNGTIQYRETPNDASTGLCLFGNLTANATTGEYATLIMDHCSTTNPIDPGQRWLIPDAEGRIRLAGEFADGAERLCVTPYDDGGVYYLRPEKCPFWYEDLNLVYFQDPATDKRWANSVANFGVNVKEKNDELKCIPQLCKANIFPKKPMCLPSAPDVPPVCLDIGMTHDCSMTRVGSVCNIGCTTGYEFKCYTDDTFTQYDDDGNGNVPALCNQYRCPALVVAAGDVKEGLAGILNTEELRDIQNV